jgi:amino acid transporter
MRSPSLDSMRGKWRIWVFWAWVAASALVALYLGLAGPFVTYFGEDYSAVALAVPALMIFMLATGLGWLVLFVASRRKRRAPR